MPKRKKKSRKQKVIKNRNIWEQKWKRDPIHNKTNIKYLGINSRAENDA